MRKILLLTLLFICFKASAQQTYWTPGVPPSSTSFVPSFRYIGTDSLAKFYIANGNRYSQFYTAAQINAFDFTPNKNVLHTGLGSVSDSLRNDENIETSTHFFEVGDIANSTAFMDVNVPDQEVGLGTTNGVGTSNMLFSPVGIYLLLSNDSTLLNPYKGSLALSFVNAGIEKSIVLGSLTNGILFVTGDNYGAIMNSEPNYIPNSLQLTTEKRVDSLIAVSGGATSPTVSSSADLTAQTTADTITSVTSVAATSTYNVGAYLNVTAVTTDVIEVQIIFTDENNTAQTITLPTVSTTGYVSMTPQIIRVKASTTITVKTTLTTGVGSITFDTGAYITKSY
jgi:hypothetical protein